MDKLLDLTRDFDAAKAAFEAYLDEYDRADDKIHLKIVHKRLHNKNFFVAKNFISLCQKTVKSLKN